jgi:hypothetical protein
MAPNPAYCPSTALSDLALAASSWFAVWQLVNRPALGWSLGLGLLWFLLCGTAASLGVLRFGGIPEPGPRAPQA